MAALSLVQIAQSACQSTAAVRGGEQSRATFSDSRTSAALAAPRGCRTSTKGRCQATSGSVATHVVKGLMSV